MTTDEFELHEVQTAHIRWHKNRPAVTATDALRQAGLRSGGALIYDPDTVDELGKLFAMADPTLETDGRSSTWVRSITREGDGNALVVSIPPEGLERLGYSLDDIKTATGDDRPQVTIHAGPGLVAFEKPPSETVALDRDRFTPDDELREENHDG